MSLQMAPRPTSPCSTPASAATRRAKDFLCASCEAVGPEEEAGCSEGTCFTPTGLAGPPPKHLRIWSEVTQRDLRPERMPLVSQPVVWETRVV